MEVPGPNSIISPFQFRENSIHSNHVFYDLVGGKDKFDQLPIIDFSTLQNHGGEDYLGQFVIFDNVNHAIMKGINGEENTQYLFIRYIKNNWVQVAVLTAKNWDTKDFKFAYDDYPCDSPYMSTLMEDLEKAQCSIKELLTTGRAASSFFLYDYCMNEIDILENAES